MSLIRKLCYIAVVNQFDFKVIHISTNYNTAADALSRLDMNKFYIAAQKHINIQFPYVWMKFYKRNGSESNIIEMFFTFCYLIQ